jgi:hypothetical protein
VPGDNGAEYTVVVSNAQGSVTSSIAVLTVNSTTVPLITVQPTNQTVIAGQAALFSVTASGTAPLSYQWRTNGVELAGATNASHTTAATVTNDSGALFSVVVSNVLGSVTSVNAVLTVNAPTAPAIDTHPADQTVSAGQTAIFAVTASGTAPLFYQWRTNGTAIGGATGAGYTTPVTVTNDNGMLYSVVVSNVAGSVTSSNALLTVTAMAAVAAAITVQPANRTVTAGQTASFSVTASGTAPLYYQWRTNAVAIGGATNTAYTTAATVTNNSGTLYTVVVSNTAGSVTSSNALLTVNAAAVVVSGLPVSDSFETYAPGFSVAGTNGWSGAGVVTGLSYAVKLPPGYPLPKAEHSRVVAVSQPLQNNLPGATNQNVAVDFMLQTGNRAAPERPALSLQAGLCVDTQGVVQVWHLYDNGGTWTQRWTALGNAPLGSSQWVRISVWLDYTSNPAGHTLFRPVLDGVVYPTGYGVAGPTNLAGPGSWYVCANSPGAGRGGAKKISGFRLESDQPCRLDDFLVTPGVLAYTELGSVFMVR